jgi:hypothetical protein
VLALFIDGLPRARLSGIADALDLAGDSAIVNFRQEIASTTSQLVRGELDATAISRKIKRATKGLKLTKIVDLAGSILTVLGVPGLAIPVLGTAATVGGVVSLGVSRFVKKRYRWALVSSRPSG